MKIVVNNLTKTYGKGEYKVNALKSCSFSIETGEQIAVTGTSGSGKSTLLHLLGCLDTPTSGDVYFDDNNVCCKNESYLAEFRIHNIGFVFQFYNLLPELSAFENIILPAMMANYKYDVNYLNSIIKKLELSDRLHHLPGQLSGGQQQRVAIARALINNPKIILCDEPTGNLDSNNSENVISLLNETTKDYGITLVVVTHDISLSKRYNRILTISDGFVNEDFE
ncbi:MAG: ABC transporter ATP-binding protein [Oscillospiraceae bacterium]|nr:ABC transporter ATP-binding protein [Oscillospiraceae bacterium]